MKYFDYEYRVPYKDTDKMGIVYYANYFEWFESARTEYFRALGLPYTQCEEKGLFLPVVDTRCRYYSPCTYDDLIVVRTSVSRLRSSAIDFQYYTFHKSTERKLTTGFSVHVFVDQAMQPVRVPDNVAELIEIHSLD